MNEPTLIDPTAAERRRVERRTNASLAELTLPEVRRILITTVLGAAVLALFLWMVKSVVIAAILGLIIGFYLRPMYLKLRAKLGGRSTVAAIVTLLIVIVPILIVLAYSYSEIADVVGYASTHQAEIVAKVDAAVQRLPFLKTAKVSDALGKFVVSATSYGAQLPLMIKTALSGFSISAAIFLFTAFYILIEAEQIGTYVAGKIPPRYEQLRRALEVNVRGVLYGAIYSTLLTQTVKSLIILGMNLAFRVPLAGALAVISFILGFFPIVGSWSVYMPVAIWLMVFREAYTSAGLMIAIGFLVNTLFISNYLRPKIAADRSGVLNFYWMFVALITGVYTFGLAGILLGPILIGLLKAIVDTVTSRSTWKLLDADEEEIAT